MEQSPTTENNIENRLSNSSLLRKKYQVKILLIFSAFICLSMSGVTIFLLFSQLSSKSKTIIPIFVSPKYSPATVIQTSPATSKKQLLTTELIFTEDITTTIFHHSSSNVTSTFLPLTIMTFNIQFYKTSQTTKPIADFILSHKPDVVCLQENFYYSDWKLTKLAFLSLDKEYFLASDCRAGGSEGSAHLSNTIYVQKKYRNFTRMLSNVNLQLTKETPRCSSVIQLYDTKLANLHLCGGRFDDKAFAKLQNHKYFQLKRLIDTHHPDIILGDFNNENSDEAMIKQLNQYKFYRTLNSTSKKQFFRYFSSGSHYLRDQTDYVPAYNETTVGSTSAFGGTPDWVYVKDQTRLTGRIHTYDTISSNLSDHNAITVEYLF